MIAKELHTTMPNSVMTMLLSITIWKKLPGPPPMWHLSSHSNVQRMGGKPGLPLSVSILGLTSGKWRSKDKNNSFTHDFGRVNPTSLLKVSFLSTGMPMCPCYMQAFAQHVEYQLPNEHSCVGFL